MRVVPIAILALVTVTTLTTWVRTSPPLDAGTYTIVYGDSELDFDVPGELSGCL